MNKENCTKGPVKWKGRMLIGAEYQDAQALRGTVICSEGEHFPDNDERKANRKLIWQAFSVLHETGMTPRELAAMVVRLRNSIRHAAHCRAPQAFHCTCDANTLWDDTKSLSKYQPKNPA